MQCKKCGTEIKEGCLFCHNCGEEVQIVPDYELGFDDFQIDPMKEQDATDRQAVTSEKIEQSVQDEHVKEEKRKPESNFKNWKVLLWGIVVIGGIVAFFTSYRSVLKQQDPEEIFQTESIEGVKVPTAIKKPEFGIPGGEYSYYISVPIKSEVQGTIYYTIDGSVPDENSLVYTKPIELSEGTTIICAFVVDEEGNSSDMTSAIYMVEFGAPDAPVIFPASGRYEGETYIRIIVPEGCLAYYTLDGSIPTESSEIYTGEFLMPEGNTTVCVVLENERGIRSEISTVEYECGYFEVIE